MSTITSYEDIDSTAVAESEVLMATILEADYNVDASLGTVIRELAVRPNAVLGAYNDARLETFKENMTLSTAIDSDSLTDDDANALASNFRIERLEGQQASGTLSLYTDQEANVYIGKSTLFTAGGLDMGISKVYIGYISDSPAADTEDVVYRKMVKASTGEYMFTIPVSTLTYTEQTLSPGMTVTMTPSDAKVTKTLIASAVTGGSAEETNASLLQRASTGITASVPSGKEHIAALLQRDVDDVTIYSSAVFGMSDPEVLRDQANISGLSMGGRVNIHARTSPLIASVEVTKTATLGADGRWSTQITADDAPGFYGISEILPVYTGTPPGVENITNSFGMDTTDTLMPDIPAPKYARFSRYQTSLVSFDCTLPDVVTGSTFEFVFTILYMPSLDIVQAYLNKRDTANNAQDTLVKAPIANIVSAQIPVTYPPGVTVVDIDTLQQAVAQAINDLEIGQRYLTADEICLAINGVDAKLRVDFPVVLESTTYLVDGETHSARSITGHLDMYTDEANGITVRNTCFFCDAVNVDITLTERMTDS